MENKKRLMDADEFLGKLQKLAEKLKNGEISEIDINLLIASTPIVDAVEMVHARWIYQDGEHICSHCKGTILYELDNQGDVISEDWPWCARCGAKMDGGND